MSTEAGKRLLEWLTLRGEAVHPHPDYIVDCWACRAIIAIEAEAVADALPEMWDNGYREAVAAERERIRLAVEGRRYNPERGMGQRGWNAALAAVIAIVNEEK